MKDEKSFITLLNEDGTESVYEILEECTVDGQSYIAVAPTEYYVLKRIKTSKKEDLYAPVEGKELDKVLPVLDKKINPQG
ncbi:MAG: DUF1292 domain-containing protein [Clostridia bacterium]|nr:DUF1292 domain-containing protein [Clostridia bacterium]